jgi:hypothetical protein
MKYLGVIAFVAALTWTWNIIHSDSPVSFETHSGIQEKLAGLIQNTIKAKLPTASDVQIEKIWTELLSPGKVKAFFVYTFRDAEGGASKTTIKGEGLLERQAEDGSGLDHWVLTKVKTTGDAIVFEDGLVVTPADPVEKK